MQQFTVPQFIDVEPKIIGPITARQFLIFLATALILFIFYKTLDFTTFVVLGVLIFAVSGVFAFLKINGRYFHYFLLNLFQFFKKPDLRIWNHKLVNFSNESVDDVKYENILPPNKYFSRERLANLSLIVDTKGKYRGGDESNIELGNDYNL